jgi:hypothetical protein
VPTHHCLGELQAAFGECHLSIDDDEALAGHAANHLAHGRTRHLETIGDSGLDDIDVVLGELEDGLAVLLECRVVLRRGVAVHVRTLPLVAGGLSLILLVGRSAYSIEKSSTLTRVDPMDFMFPGNTENERIENARVELVGANRIGSEYGS